MSVGMYSGYGKEIEWEELDEYDLYKDFPKEIADIVDGQLEGYGYTFGSYKGNLVRADLCYSNNCTEIFECTPIDLLEDAIEFRSELFEEGNLDDKSKKELELMEDYLKEIMK